MNKKKIIIICASLVLLITIPVGVTIAYLGTRDNGKTNTLTIDKGDVVVSEVFSSQTYQLSRDTIEKKVAVKNTGSEPCYVRVYLDFSDNIAKEKALLSLSENPEDTDSYKNFDSYKSNIGILSNGKWVYKDDNNALGGYFYYTEKVSGGENTELLLRYVKTDFSKDEPNSASVSDIDFISDFDIIVYSETVQTIDNGQELTWEQAWEKFLRVNP